MNLRSVGSRFHIRDSSFVGIGIEFFQGSLADAPTRRVDDAVERLTIFRIEDQFQISHHIFDFLAVIESGATYHFVGYVGADENLFHCPGLGIGAVENHCIVIASASLFETLELSYHIESFFDFVRGFEVLRFAATSFIAAQDLIYALGVVDDDTVGDI